MWCYETNEQREMEVILMWSSSQVDVPIRLSSIGIYKLNLLNQASLGPEACRTTEKSVPQVVLNK